MTENLNPSNDNSQIPILPRSAWSSELAFLKAMLKAKQALDKKHKAWGRN
jgi:hypothetical protein